MWIAVGISFVVLPLLSAPRSWVRGTLRTRGLTLAVHATGYCDRRDWSYWCIGKVVEICNLIFKKVHSHAPLKETVLWHREEIVRSGLQEIRESRCGGDLFPAMPDGASRLPQHFPPSHVMLVPLLTSIVLRRKAGCCEDKIGCGYLSLLIFTLAV